MGKFRDALDAVNDGVLRGSDINEIRLALRIAHAIQADQMSKEMYIAGEKAQTEGFVIQNPARIFQAMIEQMMKELTEGETT